MIKHDMNNDQDTDDRDQICDHTHKTSHHNNVSHNSYQHNDEVNYGNNGGK